MARRSPQGHRSCAHCCGPHVHTLVRLGACDWSNIGPAGFAGLLQQHLPIAQHKSVVPFMLQWQRLSKTMPAILFHVVWTAIFAWLDAQGLQGCSTALKRQYFTVENDQIAASWRSAPDRIMPGTDVGSAPQESWHNHKLKCHCKLSMKTPYTLAKALECKVVQGQLQVLKQMSQHGEKLQDWPHIGQFTDQHTYGNNTALAKEGRSSGQALLAWGRHLRLADSDGTVWMLVPASRLKTDWQRSKASKKNHKRQYKPREPRVLPGKAVAAFKDIVQATSVDAVELALQNLKIYDVKEKHFTDWRAAAKTFDDWRLVCFGPQASAYWQVHSAGLPPSDSECALLGNLRSILRSPISCSHW